jgi:glycerophosphoryl diester phosphodiesterase
MRYPFLDSAVPLAIPHRGGAGESAENTWTAFERVVDMGFRYIETDVRATSDGVAVAVHDDVVCLSDGRRPKIKGLTFDDITAIELSDGRGIPRLDDVLRRWPEVCFNIDIKDWHALGPTVRAVKETSAVNRVCIASFSDLRTGLARRRLGRAVCTALGPLGITALHLLSSVTTRPSLLRPRAAAIQIPLRVGRIRLCDQRLIELAHRLGLHVHVWTIDDSATMEQLLDLGVDGIMSDAPAVLREVWQLRGTW